MSIYRLRHKETGNWFHSCFFKSGYQTSYGPTHADKFDTLEKANKKIEQHPEFEPVAFPTYIVVSSDSPYKKIPVEATNFETALNNFCKEELTIHDSDNCGDEVVSVGIVSTENETRYYDIEHSWYWTDDDEDNYYLDNTFEWTQKSKDKLTKFVSNPTRDWMQV